MIKDLKKKSIYLIIFFVIIGLFLRFLYASQMTFGYDQARDALQSISIIRDHHIRIVGPTTDIKGLFHSPVFWYIMSPFYYFSHGNPEVARIPMMFINILNIVFIYYFAKKIFKNEKIALLSSLFMAVSFEAVQYGRWLSNPPPALLTIGIFFYGFWLAIRKEKLGIPIMVVFWALSVDFQFFLVYQVIFIIFAFLYLFVKERKIIFQSFKKFFWLYALCPLFFITYILAELKFKFQGLKAAAGFFYGHNQASSPLLPKIINFVDSLLRNVSVNITGKNLILAEIFILLLLGYCLYNILRRKQFSWDLVFLMVWFISPVIIYPVEKNNSYFLNIGNIYPLILLSAFMLVNLSGWLKRFSLIFLLIMVGLIITANTKLILAENKNGETLFSVQYKQILSDEKRVIDYVYHESGNKPFAINTVTNPLLMNTTWAYLFDWYARPKYGYMPHWLGYPLDEFGKEIKFNESRWDQKQKFLYLIIEPTAGIPQEYVKGYRKYENTRSKVEKTINFGNFTVEKRLLINDNNFLRDDLNNYL